MKLSNLKIATRLKLISYFLILFTIVAGLLGWQALRKDQAYFAHFSEKSAKLEHAVDIARKAQVDFKIQVQEWKNVLLRGDNPDNFKKYKAAFENKGKEVQAGLKELGKLFEEFKLDTGAIKEALRATETINEKYPVALAQHDLGKAGSAHKIDKLVKGMDRAPNKTIDQIVAQVMQASENYRAAAKKESVAQFNRIQIVLGVVVLIGIILGVVATSMVISGITRSLDKAVSVAQRVASGDLTGQIDVDSKDEIGKLLEALSDMNNALQNVVWACASRG